MYLFMNGVKVRLQMDQQIAERSADLTVKLDGRPGLRGVIRA